MRTLFAVLAAAVAAAAEAPFDVAKIESLAGAGGAWNEAEGVFKVSAPRTGVAVTVDGARLPAFAGLTSWAAFRGGKDGNLMLMGDLVVFEDEVDAAMGAALDAGLAVTALHNHFLNAEPPVFFMHIGGEGALETLAGGVGKALGAVKAIRAASPQPACAPARPLPEKSSLDAKSLEEALGLAASAKDGMLKAVVGRTVALACGCEAGKEMGVNSWAAFFGTDEDAIVDGDFAVLEGELQGLLKSLRKSGLRVVAIHHHMTGETPRMLFVHYWGRGPSEDLARAVKAALGTLGK